MTKINCILSIGMIICLIIGLPTIIYGCDYYYPTCLKYDITKKAIQRFSITEREGSYCTAYTTIDKISTCISYRHYKYWTNNIIFDTCTYSNFDSFDSYNDAFNYGKNNYINGTMMNIAVNKDNTAVCERIDGLPRNLGITGIFFLSLAGLLFVIIVICNICCSNNTNRNEQRPILNRKIHVLVKN